MHPDQETLKRMMEAAGFDRVDYFNLSAGIIALHRGVKLNATDPATGKTYRVHVQAKVVGWERVRVPAGEFDTPEDSALRICRKPAVVHEPGKRSRKPNRLYAPAVGRAVRSQGNSSHIDLSRSGGVEGPLVVKGDWLIAELVGYSAR